MDDLERAFEHIQRADFLTDEARGQAKQDTPLPIGYGQTNSQPSTVYQMLEWLDPHQGEKVLDIGSGSGWTSALLGLLVGKRGKVYAVEKIPELVKFGADNCVRAGIHNVRFFEAGTEYGLPEFSLYDRILVSAAATDLPEGLIAQLNVGGRLVIPVRNSIFVIDKTSKNNEYEIEEHPGFVFVPLV